MSTKFKRCQLPPKGWYCTLEAGHTGPCPAWPERQSWLKCLWCEFTGHRGIHMYTQWSGYCKHCGEFVWLNHYEEAGWKRKLLEKIKRLLEG